MIRLDELPVIRIPMKTRHVFRVPLRDLHVWLKNRKQAKTPEFSNYDNFLEDFDRIRRVK